MVLAKEKSWVVRLANGYVLDGQVAAVMCQDCNLTPQLVLQHHDNPSLLLYGCSSLKCRHVLIRLKVFSEVLALTMEFRSEFLRDESVLV